METNPLICSSNQWTGLYMITASVMKELSYSYFQNTVKSLTLIINTKHHTDWYKSACLSRKQNLNFLKDQPNQY